MNNFNDKYTIRDFIDKNKWSNVYIGVNNETCETIILNMLINVGPNDENLINFKEEVNLLKEINSPNLTSINNISTYMNKDKTYYYIESEYFEGLTLKELIDNNEINKNQYIEIIREVIKGIIELNHKNINYKNLSEEDIIINEEGMVKVNTLSFINNHQGHINCTDVNFKKFNEAEDVYVIGKILCKIFTGKDYYDIDNNENLDEDLIEILEKSTYKKYISKYKYNNLNEFLNDIISYLGCEELPYKDVINYEKINNNNPNNNQNNNPNKHKINKYITLAIGLIVLMGGTLLGANMLNKINTSKNTAQVSETTTKEDLDKTNNNGNTNEQNTESNKNTTSNISSNNTNEETDNNKINNENNENTSIDDNKKTDNSDDKNTENYDKENDDKVESETDQKEDSEKEDSTEEDSKEDESDEQEPDTDQKPDTDNDNNESDTVENEENHVNQDNENKSNTQNNESKNNNQGENNENQE